MFLANLAKTITNLPTILTAIEFHHQKASEVLTLYNFKKLSLFDFLNFGE